MNAKQKLLEDELIQCWRELDSETFGITGIDLKTANVVITVVRPLFDRIFRAGYEQLADPMPRTELHERLVDAIYDNIYEFTRDYPQSRECIRAVWSIVEAYLDGREIK